MINSDRGTTDINRAWFFIFPLIFSLLVGAGTPEGYGLVLRTEDGGATWTRQGSASVMPYALSDVRAFDRNLAWVCWDSGQTWQAQTLPVDVAYRGISFVGAKR